MILLRDSLGLIPYGGTRLDVATAFPEFPGSEFSGWAMKWNYSLLEPGEHTVTIIITDMDGLEVSKDVDFLTTSFKTPFIFDSKLVKTADADVSSPEDGVILIMGADIDGEIADIVLTWDRASQQFLISNIVSDDPDPENQSPQADAGPGFSAEIGETVGPQSKRQSRIMIGIGALLTILLLTLVKSLISTSWKSSL